MPEDPVKPTTPKRKRQRQESAVPKSIVNRASRVAATSIKGTMKLAMLGPRRLLNKAGADQITSDFHASTAQDLVQLLGRLKGASMKVGQLASFIDAGVLPPEARDQYQEALGSLRDSAPPMEPKLVRQVFVREFDKDPEELFAKFDMNHAAAASLGQVHYAEMDDGTPVAVKLQYPGVQSAIRSDLAMTSVVKPLLPLLAPGLEADEAMAEVRARILEECDYKLEAANLDRLAFHYSGHPFVWIPCSFRDLSGERVMTMQRASGMPFDEIKKLSREEKNRVGEILFRFYYGSLHRYGFTSADPHPGNYLLMNDGKMAFFDFGLACTLPPEHRPLMHQGLMAVHDNDVESLYDSALKMRYIRHPERIDPDRFMQWAKISLAPVVEDRNYQFTREFIAERTAAMMDVKNPWWAFLRLLNLPRWAILLFRLEIGLFAVLAQLEAEANWHKITMEFYDDCPPSTELGKLEHDWLAEKPPQ